MIFRIRHYLHDLAALDALVRSGGCNATTAAGQLGCATRTVKRYLAFLKTELKAVGGDVTMDALNVKAAHLRRKLFDLVGEFKDLHQAASALAGDDAFEAAQQADEAACDLAKVYEDLPDLFTDAHLDRPRFALKSFGKVLAHLRKAAGLSVQELADKSDVSRAMIHFLEAGDRKPSLEVAQKLAKALGYGLEVFDRGK